MKSDDDPDNSDWAFTSSKKRYFGTLKNPAMFKKGNGCKKLKGNEMQTELEREKEIFSEIFNLLLSLL